MALAFTTLSLIKQYLPVNQQPDGALTSGRDDAILNDAIAAYSQAVNDYLTFDIQTQTLTNKVYTRSPSAASRIIMTPSGEMAIRTNYPTIQSVSALAYKSQWTANWTTVDATKYVVVEALSPDERPTEQSFQIRVVAEGGPWSSWRYPFVKLWVQATFVAGYATVPAPIARACAEWIGYDYRLRAFIPTMAVGFIGFNTTQIRPARIPPHIAQLLDPWKRTY